MRRFFNLKTFVMLVMATSLLTAVTSCKDYDDDIDALDGRIKNVEQGIAALKTSMKDNKYVSAVNSAKDGIEVVFSDGSKVNVPVVGKSPVITVDADGNLMVDGEKVGNIKGPKGDKGDKGDKGSATVVENVVTIVNGELLVDGKSLDPKVLVGDLKSNASYVVEQNGTVTLHIWNKAKNAYEAIAMPKAANGLSSVVLYPENYVMGVESIVLHPLLLDNPADAPQAPGKFGPICKPVGTQTTDCFVGSGTYVNAKLKDGKAMPLNYIMSSTEVTYNVSPASVDESAIATDKLEVTSHLAAFTRAGGLEDEGKNPFTAEFVKLEKGKMTVKVSMDFDAFAKIYYPKMTTTDFYRFFNMEGYNDKNGTTYNTPVLALQVPHTEDAMKSSNGKLEPYVTSDYVNLYVNAYHRLDIARANPDPHVVNYYSNYVENANSYKKQQKKYMVNFPNGWATEDNGTYKPNGTPKPGVFDIWGTHDTDWENVHAAKELPDGVNLPTKQNPAAKAVQVIEVVDGEKVDLIDYVSAAVKLVSNNNVKRLVNAADYGLTWKFDLKDGRGKTIKFVDKANLTDQQKFIKLLDAEKGTIVSQVVDGSTGSNGAALDRTPIVHVSMLKGDCIVSEAYIKVIFVKKQVDPVVPDDMVFTLKDRKAANGCDDFEAGMNWEEVNKEIYNQLGLSHEEFIKAYDWDSSTENKIDLKLDPEHGAGSIGHFDFNTDTNNDRVTFLPTWYLTVCEMVEYACDDCTYDIPTKVNVSYRVLPKNTAYPALVFNFTGKYFKPQYNVKDNVLNPSYWNPAKTAVVHHSQSATGNSDDPTKCTYVNNLNGIFAAPNPNQSLNLPGYEATGNQLPPYRYAFITDVKKQYSEKGLKLSFNADATEMYGEGTINGVTYPKQLICKIIPHTATTTDVNDVVGADMLQYGDAALSAAGYTFAANEETSKLAKYLLNKGAKNMWVRLQLFVDCKTCKTNNEVPVTFGANKSEYFKVEFLRPINPKTHSDKKFEDGVRFGIVGSIVNFADAVTLRDWHGEYAPGSNVTGNVFGNFWKYYDIQDLDVDYSRKIQTNIYGEKRDVESTMYAYWLPKDDAAKAAFEAKLTPEQLEQYKASLFSDTADKTKFNTLKKILDDTTISQDAKAVLKIQADLDKFENGGLVYFNNGSKLTKSFSLFVPIKIRYKWGEIVTETIEVPVHVTTTVED